MGSSRPSMPLTVLPSRCGNWFLETVERFSTRGGTGFEMSTGAVRPRWRPSTANGGIGTSSRSNHWVLPTAASVGWTTVAAAAQTQRYRSRERRIDRPLNYGGSPAILGI